MTHDMMVQLSIRCVISESPFSFSEFVYDEILSRGRSYPFSFAPLLMGEHFLLMGQNFHVRVKEWLGGWLQNCSPKASICNLMSALCFKGPSLEAVGERKLSEICDEKVGYGLLSSLLDLS